MRGRFITVEGIDGAGKSSQIAHIVELLRSRGLEVVSTREPGGTRLGERLRELLLHEPMNLETEALLMFAARLEHVARVIEPALARGAWVVCDRFSDATFAYQGGGRGLDLHKIAQLEDWVHGKLQPDLTLVFDLEPEVAAGRLARAGNAPDKFEREQTGFFARVRAAYQARAANDPKRVRLVDADRLPHAIRDDVEALVRGLLQS